MLYIGFDTEKHKIIFLSETIRPRALIFGMKYHLMDLYQVVQIIALGAMGYMLYIGLNREKHEKIFSSETIRPRAMIFGM